MSNLPCKGCFWIEGGRCYQDKLADVHDLERAPRNAPLFSGLNGLEITDPLITACVERGLTKSKAAVYGRYDCPPPGVRHRGRSGRRRDGGFRLTRSGPLAGSLTAILATIVT
ncbi:hypothetical protein O9X98_14500 [Agrobacterium salinitolerans]|nr:hypothetical protein [Agrobacterium salinitolerans]